MGLVAGTYPYMCTGEGTSPRDWWHVQYTLGDQILGSEDENLTALLFFPYSLWFISHKSGFSL